MNLMVLVALAASLGFDQPSGDRESVMGETSMMVLPRAGDTPLIRTGFGNDGMWRKVVEAAMRESPDGFRARVQIVDHRAFDGAQSGQLARLAGRTTDHALLLVADGLTMTHPEHPILCIDPRRPGVTFRVIPRELWAVENNLSVANMDFDEFATVVDADGVFRGFRD